MAPVVIKYNGAWVGWTGLDDFDFAKDVIPESAPDDVTPTAGLRSRQAVPVHVDRKLFDQVRSSFGGFWVEATLDFDSFPGIEVKARINWNLLSYVVLQRLL